MEPGKKLILDDDWRGDDKPEPKKDAPGVEVDDDWKAQAQREKEELSKKLEEQEAGKQEVQKAEFLSIVESYAYQAMMFLGMVEHPQMPGKAIFEPTQAKFLIDCLLVLRDKTKGNLTQEEHEVLTQTLAGLQMSFVEMGKAMAQAAAERKAAGIKPPEGGAAG